MSAKKKRGQLSKNFSQIREHPRGGKKKVKKYPKL